MMIFVLCVSASGATLDLTCHLPVLTSDSTITTSTPTTTSNTMSTASTATQPCMPPAYQDNSALRLSPVRSSQPCPPPLAAGQGWGDMAGDLAGGKRRRAPVSSSSSRKQNDKELTEAKLEAYREAAECFREYRKLAEKASNFLDSRKDSADSCNIQ